MTLNNIAILYKNTEHSKQIIDWFKNQGIKTGIYIGIQRMYNGNFYHTFELNKNTIPIELPELNTYPKIMMVSNYLDFRYAVKRVVFMEKQGKFLAWKYFETLEEVEKTLEINVWKYAKDLPEINSQKELLLSKADELIAKAEELKKEANKL